jgi:hypothetical protein|uniref:Uncharacterized protein n=1 Tax=Siphoviridae sp. ctoiW10 TaxID=2827592 RepID=A0A8S5LP83_9CAUD|nr:MAG TPA: hypothetical protein [Siphoviridae sp. ctoiW10]
MMDAVEFIKAIKQMLSAGANNSTVQKYISAYKKNDCEGMVKAAEQWAAEHPIKTRQSVFLERYPEAAISKDGAIAICPLAISAAYRHGNGACNKGNSDTCADCKRQFWSAEVEE